MQVKKEKKEEASPQRNEQENKRKEKKRKESRVDETYSSHQAEYCYAGKRDRQTERERERGCEGENVKIFIEIKKNVKTIN